MALKRERNGAVEILTLNRPEQRNAMNPEMIYALDDAFNECERDPAVRAMILTAAGDKAFCAGMDLKAFAEAGGADMFAKKEPTGFRNFNEGRLTKPIIAAVQATAVAGGFELMMNCDIAVAAETAKFGIPEVKRGLFAAGGGVLLPARIPLAVALELGLTGDPIDARRAYELGIVNRVVPAAEVLANALQIANRIAENGPLAIAATKKLMYATATRGADVGRLLMAGEQEKVFKSQDAMEGAKAFGEKRTPQWRGV
ncbi:MAG: enoyl-CoA hydratase-related protein [Gammaproteobacteria bacterium]